MATVKENATKIWNKTKQICTPSEEVKVAAKFITGLVVGYTLTYSAMLGATILINAAANKLLTPKTGSDGNTEETVTEEAPAEQAES
jgi:hypothetical protein